MSTSPSRVRPLAAIICAALLTVSTAAFAQTTAATVPVGYMTYTLASGKTTPVGISLSESNVFTGPTATVAADAIGASGVTWTPNQFAAPGAPHFVNIMAGAQVGRTLLITGNTANTVTVTTGDTPLNGAGFALAVGDRFEIVPGDTLGTLFGSTAQTVALLGGASFEVADTVEIFNGSTFDPYYFNTTLGTWVAGKSTVNANDTVLHPWQGLMITRRGPDTSFVVTGRVPSTPLLTQLASRSSSVIALRFPADATLGSLGFSGLGTWLQGTSFVRSDTVSLWNGTKWDSYWMKPDNKWYLVGGDGTDKTATPIGAGSVISVLKRGTATGSGTYFTQALPYSLN